MNCGMSAFGTKRTWASALQMSAIGGKADMTVATKVAAMAATRDQMVHAFLRDVLPATIPPILEYIDEEERRENAVAATDRTKVPLRETIQ
jgi:hypothetical protein